MPLSQSLKYQTMNRASIYIHIPFCISKCTYCSFNSITNLKYLDEYVDKLVEEISNTKINLEIATIYIGGGTPSILDEYHLEKIFNVIAKYKIRKEVEITIEVNPESINENKLQTYKKFGINRISVGVQSLDDKELLLMNRIHTSKHALDRLKLISKHFHNISCDLIIGVNKNPQIINWIQDISKYAKSFSLYLLSFDENTKLDPNEAYITQNEDDCIEIYENAINKLRNLGYKRYEISNFAKTGYESKHNSNYWLRGTYYGFGAGAHSYIAEKELRYSNTSNIPDYIKGAEKEFDFISKEEILEEKIMLGLRTSNGIPSSFVSEELKKKYSKYFFEEGENFILNDSGMNIMNMICIDIIDSLSEL